MVIDLRLYPIATLLIVLFSWGRDCYAMTDRRVIYDFIHSALEEELSDESIIIEFSVENNPELLKLSKMQQQIDKVELMNFALSDSNVRAKFYLYDRSYIFVDVTNIKLSKNFAATARSIPIGKVIDNEDINVINVGLEKLHFKGYISQDQAMGMQARRRIPQGVLIKKKDLVSPLAIKSGNIVNVIYQGGNIKLQSVAKATQGGFIGDTIKLKTMDNKNMLLGIISDKDTVVINAKN
jgi:flagella basal body P-ring formation protein FlgA